MKKNLLNGFGSRLFCIILILTANSSILADEQMIEELGNDIAVVDNTPAELNLAENSFDHLWQDLWTLPGVIVINTKEIATDKEYWPPLLLAGAASIAMHNTNADREIADNFNLHRALGKEVDKVTEIIGGPGLHFAATGLWYLISENNNDELNNRHAWTMLKALSVTGATTLGLKLIRNNDTPNGKILAWPSGHTSSSFTVAAVLDEIYGPEVGVPAYLAAGFVGYRMMDSGDHWASDVVFGAVLGYIVGHHVAGKDKALKVAGFDVVPYFGTNDDASAVGVNFIKRF